MGLVSFAVRDFRNIATAELELSPGLNLISGANGAGKTSVLEALYFLGRAQSFRTQHPATLIREGANALLVRGLIGETGGDAIPVGIERSRTGLTARLAGKPVRQLTELIERLPFQILNPDSHRLLEGGPRYRRRFLDWGVFHVEPAFYPAWQRYSRALRQRNAALRGRLSLAEIRLWDEELIASATQLDAQRQGYLTRLEPVLSSYLDRLLDLAGLEWVYQPGWSRSRGYAATLEDGVEGDRRQGFTRVGPHRADWYPTLEGKTAQERISRGQQKQIVAAMMLAQADLYRQMRGRAGMFLVDDLASELDREHRTRVLGQLAALGCQVFLTAIDPDQIEAGIWSRGRAFHVEHGHVAEVV